MAFVVFVAALFRAGFRYQNDLIRVSARELANGKACYCVKRDLISIKDGSYNGCFPAIEAQISVQDAVRVLEIAQAGDNVTTVGETALDLLRVGMLFACRNVS